MIEQLWYTWASVGLGSGVGFRIRAASPRFSDRRSADVQKLDKYLRYKLPPQTDLYMATSQSSPRSLAFFHGEGERLLLHKAYLGKDDYGRPGVFIVHLLAGLPETFSASDAMAIINSPNWQRTRPDDAIPTKLDPMADLTLWRQRPPVLDASQHGIIEVYLPQVICAFLSLKAGQKLYLSTPSSADADILIYGLVRSLPRALQHQLDLTFSTYESDIQDSHARIIATCGPGVEQPKRLLQEKVGERGIVINCNQWYTPLSLEIDSKIKEYAAFVTNCLLKHNEAFLDAVVTHAEKYSLPNLATFLDISHLFVLIERNNIRVTDIERVLQDDTLAVACLEQQNLQNAIIDQSLQSPKWAKTTLNALNQLQQYKQGRHASFIQSIKADLAIKITTRIAHALAEQPTMPWEDSVDLLLRLTSAPTQPELLEALLNNFDEYCQQHQLLPFEFCGWGLYARLLTEWQCLGSPQEYKGIKPWLQVAKHHNIHWETLQRLLHENLPQEWYRIAIEDALTNQAPDWTLLNRLLALQVPFAWLESYTHQLITDSPIDEHTMQHMLTLPLSENLQKQILINYLQHQPQPSYWKNIVKLLTVFGRPITSLKNFICNPTSDEQPEWSDITTLLENRISYTWLQDPIYTQLKSNPPGWHTLFQLLAMQVPLEWLQEVIHRQLEQDQDKAYWRHILELLEYKMSPQILQNSLPSRLLSPDLDWEILISLIQYEIPFAWLEPGVKELIQREKPFPSVKHWLTTLENKRKKLEEILTALFRVTDTRPATLTFYITLSQQKYHYQLELCQLLLKTEQLQREEVDTLIYYSGVIKHPEIQTDKANTNPSKVRTLAQESIDTLLVYAHANYAAFVLYRYLKNFYTFSPIDEDFKVLEKLQVQRQHLREEVRSKLDSCLLIKNVFDDKDIIVTKEGLQGLEEALSEHKLSEEYKRQLLDYFVQAINHHPPLLYPILTTQAPIFAQGRLEAMLFQLVERYSQQQDQSSIQVERILTYIRAIDRYRDRRQALQNDWLFTILDSLLAHTPKDICESIGQEVQDNADPKFIHAYNQWLATHFPLSVPALPAQHPLPQERGFSQGPAAGQQRQTAKEVYGGSTISTARPLKGQKQMGSQKAEKKEEQSQKSSPSPKAEKPALSIGSISDSTFNQYKGIYLDKRRKELHRSLSKKEDAYYRAEYHLVLRLIGSGEKVSQARAAIEELIARESAFLQQNQEMINGSVQALLNHQQIQGKRGKTKEKDLREVMSFFKQCEIIFQYYREKAIQLPSFLSTETISSHESQKAKNPRKIFQFMTNLLERRRL